MINNDVLRSIRYMLDLSDIRVVEITKLADPAFPIEKGDVQAFLRRRPGQQTDVHRFGTCEVDLPSRTVTRNGKRVSLTSKEFQLLAYFLQRPGCALSRDVILNAVWGHAVFVLPRSIDRCVTTLRAKIEDDPRKPRYIQTIRDVGYRFEP